MPLIKKSQIPISNIEKIRKKTPNSFVLHNETNLLSESSTILCGERILI